jgi:hypothetical protein
VSLPPLTSGNPNDPVPVGVNNFDHAADLQVRSACFGPWEPSPGQYGRRASPRARDTFHQEPQRARHASWFPRGLECVGLQVSHSQLSVGTEARPSSDCDLVRRLRPLGSANPQVTRVIWVSDPFWVRSVYVKHYNLKRPHRALRWRPRSVRSPERNRRPSPLPSAAGICSAASSTSTQARCDQWFVCPSGSSPSCTPGAGKGGASFAVGR